MTPAEVNLFMEAKQQTHQQPNKVGGISKADSEAIEIRRAELEAKGVRVL
jgi:hypothetical protein